MPGCWARDTYESVIESIEIHDFGNGFYPSFYRNFACLTNIYSGPEYFADLDEAKEYIDEFLIRVSKLKAFW